MYFGTIKSLTLHLRICRKNHAESNTGSNKSLLLQRKNNRPVREAANRGNERMILWTSRLNEIHVDWFDTDELEHVVVEQNVCSVAEDHTYMMSLDSVMDPLWMFDTEDNE